MDTLNFDFDPAVVMLITGVIWPAIQAALDKPWWTATRRFVLVLAVGIILSLAVWFAGAYPASWQMLLTQVAYFLGIATITFNILKRIPVGDTNFIDWIGLHTPGGETTGADSTATVLSEEPTAGEPAEASKE